MEGKDLQQKAEVQVLPSIPVKYKALEQQHIDCIVSNTSSQTGMGLFRRLTPLLPVHELMQNLVLPIQKGMESLTFQ